jgi:hypothetical protein
MNLVFTCRVWPSNAALGFRALAVRAETETLADDLTCDRLASSATSISIFSLTTSTTQTWVTIFHVSPRFPHTISPHTNAPSQMPPMRNRTPHFPPSNQPP